MDFLSFPLLKQLPGVVVAIVVADRGGDKEAVVFVERNEMLVKGFVVGGRQA